MKQSVFDQSSLVMCNAFNGETFIFYDEPYNPETTSFDVVLEPGGSGGGNALVHVHPVTDETFTVESGYLTVFINGKGQLLGPGQCATVHRGMPHYFENANIDETKFTVSFSPAQNQRNFFKNFALLTTRRPQWFSAKGDPHLLLVALVFNTYRDHIYLAGTPIILQKVVFALLAPIARWFGYRLEVLP